MPTPGQPIIIVGRTLENYHQYGDPVPPTAIILVCMRCDKRLAVSPKGYAHWKSQITPETILSGAMCNICALLHTAVNGADLDITEQAEAQAVQSDTAKNMMNLFKKTAELRGKKP